MEKLVTILHNLGLSQKEAKVYLANLECGIAPASQIAGSAKLNRVSTYDILEKLKKKNLIKQSIRQKTKYFSAQNPEEISQKFEEHSKALKDSLPEFKKIKKVREDAHIETFENEKDLGKIYKNYDNKKEIEIIFNKESCLIITPKAKLKAIIIKDKTVCKELQKLLNTEPGYTKESLLKPLSEKELQKNLTPSTEIDKNLQLF